MPREPPVTRATLPVSVVIGSYEVFPEPGDAARLGILRGIAVIDHEGALRRAIDARHGRAAIEAMVGTGIDHGLARQAACLHRLLHALDLLERHFVVLRSMEQQRGGVRL